MSTDDRAPGLELRIAAASHRGRVRAANEDAVGVDGWVLTGHEARPLDLRVRLGEHGAVLAIADGMGGHRGGAEAARVALTALFAADGDVTAAVASAAEAVRTRAAAAPELAGMGTTLVGVRVLPDGAAEFFNVGDSRAYRAVEGYLAQVSIDDRPVPVLPADRGVVTQHLGGDRVVAVDPHVLQATLAAGDRVLLCSDGLHDMVDDGVIAGCLGRPVAEAAAGLLDAALGAGGEDNVSIVVVDVVDVVAPRESGS